MTVDFEMLLIKETIFENWKLKIGNWYQGPESNRQGVLSSGGFSSHCDFHRQPFQVVCALDYVLTLIQKDFRFPPFSLYTFRIF